MLYDSGCVLIRLIHGLNSYINSNLSMIVYGGAKISVRLILYRLKPLKITQLQEPYNSLIPMSHWIIWLAKIIFS